MHAHVNHRNGRVTSSQSHRFKRQNRHGGRESRDKQAETIDMDLHAPESARPTEIVKRSQNRSINSLHNYENASERHSKQIVKATGNNRHIADALALAGDVALALAGDGQDVLLPAAYSARTLQSHKALR